MKITEMQAYKRLEESFKEKGYSQGKKDNMRTYFLENAKCSPDNLTPGHYVDAVKYGKIKFRDVPGSYRTRGFFLHTLSGTFKDIVEYVKENPEMFDRQFFKDHIATDYYSLEFELNDFEYMPIEYIDEEMVACAMFRSIDMRYIERRGDCEDWFYSVYKRKPEVLNQDLYILGARCFAEKRNGKNEFLDITPEKYRTPEYYFALCIQNRTPVMEDIPEDVLTTKFLVRLLNDSSENITCFSETALERKVPMMGVGTIECWKATIINDGYQIKNIPLNDERVEFFLSRYDKDSFEYECSFKNHYKKYLRQKNSIPEPKNGASELGGMLALVGAMAGMKQDEAISIGNKVMNDATNRQTMLPIHYMYPVPMSYQKMYDREEYLLEIYKKIGILIVDEADYYYYNAILPEDISIEQDSNGYWVKDSKGNELIHYYDRGPFYDRTVQVDQINVNL